MRHQHHVIPSPDRPRDSHPHGRLRLRRIALAAGLCLAGVGLPGMVVAASATEAGEPEASLEEVVLPDGTDVDLDAELIEPLVVIRPGR